MKSGIERITAERERQISVEGWTPAGDDQHSKGQLSDASACYAIAAGELANGYLNPPLPSLWPWDMKWWKPGDDPIRCLEKAGALAAAEIDRLERLRAKHSA